MLGKTPTILSGELEPRNGNGATGKLGILMNDFLMSSIRVARYENKKGQI